MSNFKDKILADPSFLHISKNISRLLHSQIIAGFDADYNEEFCIEVICKLLENENKINLAEKVRHRTMVDLMIIDGDKSIKVEDIEPIIEKSCEKGIECDQKFCIIKNAQLLTVEAQNKLLKTLEEPSNGMYFFLCVPSRFLLLNTIVSRSNVVEIGQHNQTDIEQFVRAQTGCFNSTAKAAAEQSLGSFSRAIELAKKPDETFELVLQALANISSSANTLKYAVKIQKSDINLVVEYAEFILLDALKLAYGIEDIWFESRKDQIEKIATCSPRGLVFIYNVVNTIKQLAKVNVSPIVLADKFALAIAEGKHI